MHKGSIKFRKENHGIVTDTIYEFLAKDIQYARIDDICNRHSNGNNLRKSFANRIKTEGLEDVVEVTIRGNDVFLVRLYK